MTANVTLNFDIKQKSELLSKMFGQRNKKEIEQLNAVRVCFSAARFLNYSSDEQVTEVVNAISIKAKSEGRSVILEEPLRYLKSRFNCEDVIIWDAAVILPAKFIYLFHDAVIGMPKVADFLESNLDAVSWDTIAVENTSLIPKHSWVEVEKNIYPINIPEAKFNEDLDLILIDCPSRNLSMMPNGLGYVHNAVKRTGIRHAVYDIDIVAYHRYHMNRIFNIGENPSLPSGKTLPKDPWLAEHYDIWDEKEIANYIYPMIEDIVEKICNAKPKIVGFSIQQCNQSVTEKVASVIKEKCPSTVIVVGGFSCYNPNIGLKAFPLADYMCIGEADLTVGELMSRLASGEIVKDMPGVISRHDEPFRLFVPAPMENDLDKLEDPRYEWFPLSIYRNWDGYQLTPVIASRGCRWSRCTFCAERFYWRVRDPKKFVDELEYLVSQGCYLFMFNESDLNGAPEVVMEICDEIIRRKLKIKLTAQLRIHKKSDKAFFEKLAAAGFVALRFGVDAFSENTLKLQKKGYTKETVEQNLRDCHECGIYTEVNWVIGIPGETEKDCDEGVEFIIKNKEYIGRVANINPLMLFNGSVYWIDPASHGIRFNGDKDKIFKDNDRYIPSSKWYSVDPFIDSDVRRKRYERIIVALLDGGFELGPWAQKLYEQVREHKNAEPGESRHIKEKTESISL